MASIVFGTSFALGLLILVIGAFLGDIGDAVDFDLDADTDFDLDGDSSPSFFNIRVLSGGAAGFGGFGLIGQTAGWPLVASSLFAVLGGVLVAAGTYALIAFVFGKMQGSHHIHSVDFVNQSGQVTVAIPATGIGKVALIAPGSGERIVLSASSNSGRLPNGTTVTVVDVQGGNLVVEQG